MRYSTIFNINIYDLGKGFILTAITTVLTTILTALQDGRLPSAPEFKSAALIGLIAGASYLVKNLLTGIPKVIEIHPEQTTVVNKETKEVIINAKAEPPVVNPEALETPASEVK